MSKKIALMVFMLTLVATAGGCYTGFVLDKQAFSKPKRFAVITNGGKVIERSAKTPDRQKLVMSDLGNIVIRELGKSTKFKLVKQSAVVGSTHYKSIKDDMKIEYYVSAEGYKYFDPNNEKANLDMLAKELGVDGFVYVWVQYNEVDKGRIPPSPVVSVSVSFTDLKGTMLWFRIRQAFRGNYAEMAGNATRYLVEDLDELLSEKN